MDENLFGKMGFKNLHEFFEFLQKKRAEAAEDIPDDRWQVAPRAGVCPQGMFYEDAWIRIELAKTGNQYKMTWTQYRKTKTDVTEEYLQNINSQLEALRWLKENTFDYWSAGTIHPLFLDPKSERLGIPHLIPELFSPLEQQLLNENSNRQSNK